MTTNEKTFANIVSMINTVDVSYTNMSTDDILKNGKFFMRSLDGKALPYQYDRKVREYDRASKSFVVKESYGFTIYPTKESNCLRIVTMNVSVYARPAHDGSITLSYNEPKLNGVEEIDAEHKLWQKTEGFAVAKSYLLKKYNFATMKFDTLMAMYTDAMRLMYAEAMKAKIEASENGVVLKKQAC